MSEIRTITLKNKVKAKCEVVERHNQKFYVRYEKDLSGETEYSKPFEIFIPRKTPLYYYMIEDAEDIIRETTDSNRVLSYISVKDAVGYYLLHFQYQPFYKYDRSLYLARGKENNITDLFYQRMNAITVLKNDTAECTTVKIHDIKFRICFGMDIYNEIDLKNPTHVFIPRKTPLYRYVIDDAMKVVREINENRVLSAITTKDAPRYYTLWFIDRDFYEWHRKKYRDEL